MAKPQRKITLFLNNKEQTFYSKFASARNVFKAQNLMQKMETFETSDDENKPTEEEMFMEILDFLATDIYHNQFTADDMLIGTDSADFIEMVQSQLIMVMTRDVEGLKKVAMQAQ